MLFEASFRGTFPGTTIVQGIVTGFSVFPEFLRATTDILYERHFPCLRDRMLIIELLIQMCVSNMINAVL